MKATRKTEFQLDWQEREKFISELAKENGIERLTYIEKVTKFNSMPEEEAKTWLADYNAKIDEMEEAWSDVRNNILETGQVELNKRNNDLDAFCSVFQRADRILTGLANVEVNIHEEGDTDIPAWSDGKSVTFNGKAIKQIDETSLMSLHGLNYHEVAHLLYTPRVGSELGAWVKEHSTMESVFDEEERRWFERPSSGIESDIRIQYAFNLLEDFRAENYLVTKYPSVVPFLKATISDYLLTDNDDPKVSFIVIAGRQYLGKELLSVSGKLFAQEFGVEQAIKLFTLATEYRSLVFPKDYARAKDIIRLIAEYLPATPKMPSGCGRRDVMRNGRVSSGSDQEKVAENFESDLSPEELNKMFDDLMSGKSQDGEQAGEAGQGTSTSADNTAGDSNGSTPTKPNPNGNPLSDKLASLLEQAVEEAKQDREVQRKLVETNKAIKKNSNTKSFLPRQARSMSEPSLADVTAVRSFTQELERLRIDSDPDWDREKPTGKLNVMRAMQADVNDINKLFDRWETGNDDYDIEACILLDRSGSMWNDIELVSKASWIIKRSLEKINASVSVMTFNDSSRILYSADEKAGSNYPIVQASGSTDPRHALQEVERIMLGSKKKTKLLFLLTDGQFFGGESDKSIANLNAEGVFTSMVFLSSNESWGNWATENAEQVRHGAQSLKVITKPLDLVKVAKEVVNHHLSHA